MYHSIKFLLNPFYLWTKPGLEPALCFVHCYICIELRQYSLPQQNSSPEFDYPLQVNTRIKSKGCFEKFRKFSV